MMRFLSTPSARRATHIIQIVDMLDIISIHALREEGDRFGLCAALPVHISIHALREEGDVYPQPVECGNDISIHALREEGDIG